MKQNNQSSQQNPNQPIKPQVTSRVRINSNPAMPPNQEKEKEQETGGEERENQTSQSATWNEQEFRQRAESEMDVMDVIQPFVMAHEGVKNWHDALLSKVGLGEVNRKVWAIVDKVRDNSLVMIKRQYGKKNRKQASNPNPVNPTRPTNSASAAQKPGAKPPNLAPKSQSPAASAAPASDDDDTTKK